MSEQIPENPFYGEISLEKREREKYNHELAFIGDTNGDFFGFLKNILSLGYVEIKMDGEKMTEKIILNYSIEDILKRGEILWIGENSHIVQVGDILGDRQGEGDCILTFLSKVRVLAQEKGGNVIVNLGNHDAAALLYLVYGQTRGVIDIHPCPLDEYVYFSYDTDETNAFGSPEICFDREGMYQDEALVKHIQEIKENYQIIHVDNETLFLHADVSPSVFMNLCIRYSGIVMSENPEYCLAGEDLSLPLSKIADRMQRDFKKDLEELFPEKKEGGRTVIEFISEEKRQKIVEKLFEIGAPVGALSGLDGDRSLGHKEEGEYLSEYRSYPNVFIDFLRDRGIKRIVFGHTQHTLQVYDDFQVISADGRATSVNQKYSFGKIGKDGFLDYHVSPRSPEDAEREKRRMKRKSQ